MSFMQLIKKQEDKLRREKDKLKLKELKLKLSKVAEKMEDMVLNGLSSIVVGGSTITYTLDLAELLGIEFLRATLPASAISVSIYLFLQGFGFLDTNYIWICSF